MTGADFRCNREFLGLPVSWVAENLGVTTGTVNRWERGERTIPPVPKLTMEAWISRTSKVIGQLTIELPKRELAIKAAQDDCPAELLDRMPASWHRMIAARVAERTGLGIEWHS